MFAVSNSATTSSTLKNFYVYEEQNVNIRKVGLVAKAVTRYAHTLHENYNLSQKERMKILVL